MIEASQILRIPLIVTEQNPDKLGRTVPELDISKANLLDAKMKFSMYTPSVASFFQHNQNLKSVVLFGIEAHVCVYQTALDFLGQNYQVFLVSDGISAQDEAEIPVALEQLRTFGAVVSSSDSLLFQLLGGATHPDFKAVSSLVKTHSSSKL